MLIKKILEAINNEELNINTSNIFKYKGYSIVAYTSENEGKLHVMKGHLKTTIDIPFNDAQLISKALLDRREIIEKIQHNYIIKNLENE